VQFKKKSVFRTSIGVTCAYWDLQSAAHSGEGLADFPSAGAGHAVCRLWGHHFVLRWAIWGQTACPAPAEGKSASPSTECAATCLVTMGIVTRKHCPAEYHAGMSDLKQIPDVSAQHTLSHSGTIFFCHGTNLFFASHPFGQNLPSICMSNPNEMVDFLICLTFSTKNCLSNT